MDPWTRHGIVLIKGDSATKDTPLPGMQNSTLHPSFQGAAGKRLRCDQIERFGRRAISRTAISVSRATGDHSLKREDKTVRNVEGEGEQVVLPVLQEDSLVAERHAWLAHAHSNCNNFVHQLIMSKVSQNSGFINEGLGGKHTRYRMAISTSSRGLNSPSRTGRSRSSCEIISS